MIVGSKVDTSVESSQSFDTDFGYPANSVIDTGCHFYTFAIKSDSLGASVGDLWVEQFAKPVSPDVIVKYLTNIAAILKGTLKPYHSLGTQALLLQWNGGAYIFDISGSRVYFAGQSERLTLPASKIAKLTKLAATL